MRYPFLHTLSTWKYFTRGFLVVGVIDTVYTGFDFRTYLVILSTPGRTLPGGDQRDQQTGGQGIYAYDESVDVRPKKMPWLD